MKITELIEELQCQLAENGDMEVMSSSDYGDISHTEQLEDIASIETCTPVDSAYSRTGLAFPREDEDELEPLHPVSTILVLRYTY